MSTVNGTNIQLPFPPPDPSTVLGPIFIGTIVNWMLMGTLIVQVYIFYLNFIGDPLSIQILVYGLFLLDIVQTVVGTHLPWYYSVASWSDSTALVAPVPWSLLAIPILDGLTAAIVQIFYAWRIWTLGRTKIMRGLAILIVLGALLQMFSAVVPSSLILSQPSQREQLNLLGWDPLFELWLASTFVTDILLTGCMLWILYDAKSRTSWSPTETLLSRLITNTIQSGTVTVVCAAIDLALFVAVSYHHPFYHLMPIYIFGKLYSNSLMATLNARKHTRKSATDSENSHSLSMHVHVSRETDRTNGNLPSDSAERWPSTKVSGEATSDTWAKENVGVGTIPTETPVHIHALTKTKAEGFPRV